MMGWQPIKTAPKDKHILLYGKIDPRSQFDLLRWEENSVFSGYWDIVDDAWSPSGGTWKGPFMKCTHWKPLPKPPKSAP